MNIVFDNIIFSLQKAGGISVVWKELLERVIKDSSINSTFIENVSENLNIFRNEIYLDKSTIIESNSNFPSLIERYMRPDFTGDHGVFHSSYYRTSKNSNFVNVTTVHDFTYELYRKGLAKFIHHQQKGKAIYESNKIICVSENTKKDLMRFYPKTNEDDVKVIYNGVDSVYKPIKFKSSCLKDLLIPFESGEYVLFVGDRISSYKNFNLVVNCCQKLEKPLVIVGGSILTKNETSFLTEKLGGNSFNHLRGINNSQLNIVYNNALCLLYPSLYEGFGIPILEAQKAGCPVISSCYSSIPEVAGDGAILLDDLSVSNIVDKINELINNSYVHENLISSGRINSEKFSWDKCYEKTKEVYSEIYNENF